MNMNKAINAISGNTNLVFLNIAHLHLLDAPRAVTDAQIRKSMRYRYF